MREMKDSGIEWIGEIPKHWTVKNLKYIFDITSGSTPASGVSQYWDGDIKWITPADFKTNDVYVFGGRRNITGLALMSCSTQVIPDSSIIFSKRAPIGSVVITGEKMCINQGCLALVSKHQKTSVKFYYYALSILDKIFDMLGSGTTFKEISAFRFSNTSLQCPHFEEQQQIADFLDTQCSEIDATAEDIQKEISLLEKYKKSVITEAVTKGLNPDAEMKDSGIEWVGKVPVTWKIMPNKYIMTKKKVIKEVYDDENIISLSMNGVIVRDLEAGGKMPKTFDGYQIVYPGNLLMCLFDYDVTPRCIGLIKDYGVTSPAYSQFVMNNDNYSGYYYYYYLMIDHAKTLLHLAKNLRHSFTEEQLGAILAPVPTVEEQYQIVNYLDSKCSEIDTLIADKKRQLDILADYKKSLIYEYVTGKKEVPVNE